MVSKLVSVLEAQLVEASVYIRAVTYALFPIQQQRTFVTFYPPLPLPPPPPHTHGSKMSAAVFSIKTKLNKKMDLKN